MTSASRTEPPGWMAQVAPASAAAIKPSANGKNVELRLGLGRRRQKSNQAQIFFLLQKRPRVALKFRRDNHFAKYFADRFGERFIDRLVADNHSAEWRLLIGRESFLPRRAQIRIAPDAARIGVFQNRDRRLRKFGDQIHRRADVENVVKGKIFAVQLLETRIEVAV